ncbi:MAG TPA: hypothetical protein VKE51_34275 [Vicinamibacterales bacterium]|nr:hypothetical protein [Vicinamibacterales bacterium]
MKRRLTASVAICVFAACLPARASQPAECSGDEWVRAGAECLHVETYSSETLSGRPTLVVAVHGDSPFSNPQYQYQWAEHVARENPNVIAVGVLRPGYTDGANHHSTGVRGMTTGDNYTPGVVDAIADAVRNLRATFSPAHVVIAWHSGGAALAAGVMGKHPGVADAAVLVSCPCDVARWRAHMKAKQGGAIWDRPVDAVSPDAVVDGIDPAAKLVVIVGDHDDVAPPELSRDYRDRLQKRALSVTYVEVPGTHEIFADPAVFRSTAELLRSLR